MRKDITKLLRENPYPGRGIVIGCSEDGKRSIVLYFIMGRSENSRNRIFAKTDDGIRTAAYDESKMTDPSLIIYHPVRILGDVTIVSNGDQTDTIRDVLTNKNTFQSTNADFASALETREFEPDKPNYTPRISGIVENNGAYALSILKTIEGDNTKCQRQFFEYSAAVPGLAHYISTYETDGDPLPSFCGEPIAVSTEGSNDFEAFAGDIWNAMNKDNKVSLYARERDISTHEVKEIIHNINK